MTRINLLPWRERRRQRAARRFGLQLAAAFGLAALLAMAFGFHLAAQLDRQERRNHALAQDVAALDGRLAALDELRRGAAEIEQRAGVLAALWQARATTLDVLGELARAMADGVRYTRLARRGDAMSAQGLAASNERVAALMRRLHASERFAEVRLRSVGGARGAGEAAAGDGEALAFELDFAVIAPGADAPAATLAGARAEGSP